MGLQGLRHIQNIWARKVGERAPTSTPGSNARTLSETTPVRVEYSPACQELRGNGHLERNLALGSLQGYLVYVMDDLDTAVESMLHLGLPVRSPYGILGLACFKAPQAG